MTISLDARTPSADIHTLTGSTPPGAAQHLHLLSIDPGMAAGIGPAHLRGATPDAEVIDLAERVKALAVRDHRIWDRRAAIDDAVSRKFRCLPMPSQPKRTAAQSTISEVEADGVRTTTITVPTTPDPAYEAASAAYAAARAADMEAGEENRALRRKVLIMPARTMDGILLKARVARWCFMDDEDEIAQHLATEAKDSASSGETLAFSILLDLARMVGAAPAAIPARGTASNLNPVSVPAGLSAFSLGADAAGDVREWYRSWLYAELRLLNLELDGSTDKLAIRQDNPGAAFHYPAEASWTDVPKPSTRAAAVLSLFGILPSRDCADDLARVA